MLIIQLIANIAATFTPLVWCVLIVCATILLLVCLISPRGSKVLISLVKVLKNLPLSGNDDDTSGETAKRRYHYDEDRYDEDEQVDFLAHAKAHSNAKHHQFRETQKRGGHVKYNNGTHNNAATHKQKKHPERRSIPQASGRRTRQQRDGE